MTALPPDQLHAIQAILAQQAPAQAEQIAQSIAVTVQSSPIDANAIARAIFIEGTATKSTAIDQLLLRTGQGDFLLRIPETARQHIMDTLPSRMVLQLRPGPNGLEAVLVMGSRAAQQIDQVQQSLSSSATTSRQTLTSEIPKVGQVFQIMVIPSTLLSNLIPHQNKGTTFTQLSGSVNLGATGLPPQQVAATSSTPSPVSQVTVSSVKQSSNVIQTGNVSAQPAPAQPNQSPVHSVNESAASSRNHYDSHSTQGQLPQSPSGQTLAQPHQKQQPSQDLSLPERQPQPKPVTPNTLQRRDNTINTPNPTLPQTNQPSRPQLLPLRIITVLSPQHETPTLQSDSSNTAKMPIFGINKSMDKPMGSPPVATPLTALVRGTTPSGQPILTIDDQVAVVNTTKNWPIGTKLHVVLGAGAELVIEKELKSFPLPYDSLRQVLDVLGQQNQLLMNEVKHFRIPIAQTGHIAGALLFFLTALKKGSINAWLGDDARDAILASGKSSLLTTLNDEMEGGRIAAVDHMGTAWKGSSIPYFDSDQLRQFYLYAHQDPHHKQHEKSERDMARRFLIDVSLSRLGPLQIDGLIKTNDLENQRKLDVIVRTVNALPEALRNELRMSFAHAMEEVRYAGTLLFQTNKQGWVSLQSQHDPGRNHKLLT